MTKRSVHPIFKGKEGILLISGLDVDIRDEAVGLLEDESKGSTADVAGSVSPVPIL